ncbi:MAG TPA: TonB-dependent receptor [Novosphingobium sp.]|nr:TonB-dependent receptor [Novosphingobium sp.]
MGSKTGLVALMAGTALCTVAAPALAHAADAAAQPAEQGLGDIVVTATRTSSSVQKTPVAVTAFSSEQLKKLQVTNVKDLGQIAPNVQISQVTGGSAGIAPYIRGGAVTDGANVTSEAEVGIYIDDVYQPRAAASFIEALDIERIEVLRGPQGTLYGRNSSAGALKIVTREPGTDMHGGIELGTGIWNERMAKAYASGAINQSGTLRAGFSALYRQRDGGRQYDVTLGRKVGAEKFAGFQGELDYVGTNVKARLKGYYSYYDSDGQYAVPTNGYLGQTSASAIQPLSGSYRNVYSPVPSFTTDKQYGTSLNIDVNLGGGAKLQSITAWSRLSDGWREDFSGGVPYNIAYDTTSTNTAAQALYDRTSYMSDENFSQELHVSGSLLNDRLTYLAGLYYFYEKGTQDVYTTVYGSASTLNMSVDTNSYAAFGQLSFKILPNLTLSAGGRYTEDHKTLNGNLQDGVAADSGLVNRRDKWHNFLPRVALDWQAMSHLMFYASFSEGFKAGGYNGLAGSVTALNSPYGPQSVKAYEIGMKSEFWDRKARLNLAAFYNDYSSLQQQSVDGSGNFLTQNYAARHEGIEAEFSVKPVSILTLWANGVWNNGKYKASAETSAASTTNYVGNWMTNVFKHQYTVGADLTVPTGPGEAQAGINYNARSDYYSTPDNLAIGHVPATNLVNAYVGYTLDNWSLRFSVKNLTNQIYYTTGFGFYAVWPRFMADPRTWKLTASYKF